MKLFIVLLMLTSLTAIAQKKDLNTHPFPPPPIQDLVLDVNNIIVLRGKITAESASDFVYRLKKLAHSSDAEVTYIYINSPGGSVFAGDYIATAIESFPRKTVAFIDFAASMAFHVSHFADETYILRTGTMMQHHASGGTGRGVFPNVQNRWDWVVKKLNVMHALEAERCKFTTLEEYNKNIAHDWWLLADEAISSGCADRIVETFQCSKELFNNIKSETRYTRGMKIVLKWSACPSIFRPISSSASRLDTKPLTQDDYDHLEHYLSLIVNPKMFYIK